VATKKVVTMFCEECGTLKSINKCPKCSRPKATDQGTPTPKAVHKEGTEPKTCVRCEKVIPDDSQYTYCFVCRNSSFALLDKKREDEYDQEKENKEDGY